MGQGREGKGNRCFQSAWDANRRDNPYQFYVNDLLCDVTLTVSSDLCVTDNTEDGKTTDIIDATDPCQFNKHVDKRSFHAHRLILACHSDYFNRMFTTSGMREVTGEVSWQLFGKNIIAFLGIISRISKLTTKTSLNCNVGSIILSNMIQLIRVMPSVAKYSLNIGTY